MASSPDKGEFPQPSEQELQKRLLPAVDYVLTVENPSLSSPGKVEELADRREKLIAVAMDPKEFAPWEGFRVDLPNLPSERIEKGKIRIGAELMDRLEWQRDLKGTKREKKGDLQRLMVILKGKQPLSLTDLRELESYFIILKARCRAIGLNEQREDFSGVPSEKQKEALEFVEGIGRIMGNPLTKAILERDRINRKIPDPIKNRKDY